MQQSLKPMRAPLKLPFSVRINALQLAAILQRMKGGEKRTLNAWIEDGLRLALLQPIQKRTESATFSDSVQAQEPVSTGKSRVAVAWQAYEELLAVEERRATASTGVRRTEGARDA